MSQSPLDNIKSIETEMDKLTSEKLRLEVEQMKLMAGQIKTQGRDAEIRVIQDRVEHARRNIEVLSKLRIESNGYEHQKICKEVLDALKENIAILSDVKLIKR